MQLLVGWLGDLIPKMKEICVIADTERWTTDGKMSIKVEGTLEFSSIRNLVELCLTKVRELKC